MANPTAKPDTEVMDFTGLALRVAQIQDESGSVVGGITQQATVADVASTIAAIVTTNMDDGSADNTLIALDTATGTYNATEASNIEKNFDKISDEVNAAKTDIEALVSKVNAILVVLENAGIVADA